MLYRQVGERAPEFDDVIHQAASLELGMFTVRCL